jgi:hypothetical protein
MTDVPEPGFRKYWRQALSSQKCKIHAIKNKDPEDTFCITTGN